MTNEEKAKKLASKIIAEDQNNKPLVDILMEMAEWKEQQMIEKACDAYCKICDTQECFNDGNCNWVKKFRKAMEE